MKGNILKTKILEYKEKNNCSVMEIALKCGLNNNGYISKIINGANPSFEVFLRICKGLKINPNEILEKWNFKK